MQCQVKNCNSKYYGKGYCNKHYQQQRKHGKVFDITNQDLNEVVDKGTHYELILTNIKMEEIGRAKIDKEDLFKVQAVGRWTLTNHGYVHNKANKILMHRLVMGVNDSELVDHKKVGIKYRSDNRKKRLRICTRAQNEHNTKKRKNNTSGYKGVTWRKNLQKWIAQISIGKNTIYLGSFVDIKDAVKARKVAAKEMHKEFYCS